MVRRHVGQYERARGYRRSVADRYRSKNAGMRGNVDVIADVGDAGRHASADRANLAQCAVDPDLDALGHPDLRGMLDKQTGPYFGVGMQIDTGHDH